MVEKEVSQNEHRLICKEQRAQIRALMAWNTKHNQGQRNTQTVIAKDLGRTLEYIEAKVRQMCHHDEIIISNAVLYLI